MKIFKNIRKCHLINSTLFYSTVQTFCFISLCYVYAQPVYNKQDLTILGVKDGLPNEWISEIQEDQYGFMWFGTQYGLSRYDGKEFINFKFDPEDSTSLPLNWVLEIEVDNEGYLWVGMLKALARMNPQTFKFTNYTLGADATNLPRLIDMVVDAMGFVWVSTDQGLFLGRAGQFQFKKIIPELEHPPVRWSNGVAFEKDNQLFYWEGPWTEPLFISSPDQLPNDPDHTLLLIKDMKISGLSRQQMKAVWGNYWTLNAKQDDVYYYSENNLWKYSIAQHRQYQILDLYEIFSRHITPQLLTWYIDRNNNLWVATSKGVLLLKHRPDFFKLFATKHARDIKCMAGSIWIGGEQGLFEFDYQGKLKKKWTSMATSSFDVSGNNLIGGTLQGEILSITLPNGPIRFNKFPKEGKSMHNIFYTVIHGHRVFWGGNPYLIEGDLTLSNFKYISLKDKQGDQHPDILSGIKLDGSELWIGTVTGGVFVFSLSPSLNLISRIMHHPNLPGSLSSNVVFDIYPDLNDQVLIATESGLTGYNRQSNTFKRWREKDGMVDEKIMSIQSGENGQYWISTISHGLMRWIPATNRFQNFTDQSGLVSNDFLFGSSARDSSGRLLFGTDQGVVLFNPKDIPLIQPTPEPIYLTSCLVNDQPFHKITGDTCRNIQFKKNIQLNYDQNRITFTFSQPHRSTFSATPCQYRFVPQDDVWLPLVAGERLNYNKVPPGHHQLLVKNNNLEHELLSIVILPPWYRTFQAYAGFGLLALLLLGISIRKFLQSKLRAQRFKHDQELIQTRSHYFLNLTHELKTPLQLIQGPIQLIKQKLEQGNFPEEVKDLLQLADTHTGRIASLVGQMETLHKLDQANLKKEITSVSINTFLHTLLHSFDYRNSHPPLSLHFNSEIPDSTRLSLDQNHLTSIVYNLIQNVYDHAQGASWIKLQVKYLEDQLQFSVSDDGMGIKPEDQPYIFDRFYTKSVRHKGTGLGLALVKELVLWLGGAIWYKNSFSGGSIFLVSLPAMATSDAFEEQELNPAAEEIVIVEDEPNMAQFIRLCLPQEMKVTSFTSASPALDYIIRAIPDLILTDRMMPGLDGIQFSQSLKKHALTRHIPIIMISGKSDLDSRVEAYRVQVDIFLSKPFSVVELQQVITQLLENRRKLKEVYSSNLELNAAPDSFQDPFIKSLMGIIENELHLGELNTDAVCRKIAVSRTQLFRKCTALFGMSFHQVIQQKRLVRAKGLLLAKPFISIAEVAAACGFKDPNYFSKFFKKETSYNPLEFRQNPHPSL